jgi:hypothetical protein
MFTLLEIPAIFPPLLNILPYFLYAYAIRNYPALSLLAPVLFVSVLLELEHGNKTSGQMPKALILLGFCAGFSVACSLFIGRSNVIFTSSVWADS